MNARAGARPRLAAITHSLVLLPVVLVASQWVSHIPLAALAGVLLATVAFDLVTAVILGLVVAGAFALQQTARTARVDEVPLDETDHSAEERSLLDEHTVAFRLEGPLFFGARPPVLARAVRGR